MSRSVTAMAESYSVKSLLVHLREKLATSPTTTSQQKRETTGPPSVKQERRKRERELKRKADKEKRRKEQEPGSRSTQADQRSANQRHSAWSDRPADIPSAEWGKLREATKKKYASHCHAYLIGKAGCTNKDCKNGAHTAPADWRAFLTEQGF